VVGTALTIEGWALYCEEMMGEAGFYDLEERFFQRVHLLWRAVAWWWTWASTPGDDVSTRPVQMLVDRLHFDRATPRPRCAATAPCRRTSCATRWAEGIPAPRKRTGLAEVTIAAALPDGSVGFGGLPVSSFAGPRLDE